jgi:hypothetical protein
MHCGCGLMEAFGGVSMFYSVAKILIVYKIGCGIENSLAPEPQTVL